MHSSIVAILELIRGVSFFSGLYIFYLMEVVVALFRSKSGIHGHSHSSYQLKETNEIPKNVIVPYF
jgi:hypothetical protein